jgi:RecB family exonuclease
MATLWLPWRGLGILEHSPSHLLAALGEAWDRLNSFLATLRLPPAGPGGSPAGA